MSQDLQTYLHGMAPAFKQKNDFHLNFENECHYAVQLLERNNFLMKVAGGNQKSLQNAIMNVAAIGLSLNPADKHAYLVPRDGAVHLDISYQGIKKLATDSGAIVKCAPELVYEGEPFKWNGAFAAPDHEMDPFARSEDVFDGLRGGYVIAVLPDNSLIVTHMSVKDILKVRDTSKSLSGNQAKYSPWTNWPDQMVLKTIVRRAAKSWPQSTRVAEAIAVVDQDSTVGEVRPDPELDKVRAILQNCPHIDEAALCLKAGTKSLEEIQPERLPRMIQWLETQTEKAA